MGVNDKYINHAEEASEDHARFTLRGESRPDRGWADTHKRAAGLIPAELVRRKPTGERLLPPQLDRGGERGRVHREGPPRRCIHGEAGPERRRRGHDKTRVRLRHTHHERRQASPPVLLVHPREEPAGAPGREGPEAVLHERQLRRGGPPERSEPEAVLHEEQLHKGRRPDDLQEYLPGRGGDQGPETPAEHAPEAGGNQQGSVLHGHDHQAKAADLRREQRERWASIRGRLHLPADAGGPHKLRPDGVHLQMSRNPPSTWTAQCTTRTKPWRQPAWS